MTLQPAENRDPLADLPRHGLLNVAATLAPGIYSVVLASYVLHSLGPNGYAPWVTAMALVGWLTLLDAGLANTTTREAAQALAGNLEAEDRVKTTNTLYAALGVGAVFAGSTASLSIPLLLHLSGDEARNAWLVGVTLSVDLGIVLATSAWMGVLRGARRFDLVLLGNVAQVIVALGTTLILFPHLGLIGAGCGQIVGRLTSRLVVIRPMRRAVPWFALLPRRRPRVALIAVGGFSLPILAMQVATQLGIGTDVGVVGVIAGSTSVGIYAAGSQLARYSSQFLFAGLGVILPTFSHIVVSNPERARSTLLRAVFLGTILGSAAFGGLALEASQAVRLWAGTSDPLSVNVLRLYAIAYIGVTPANIIILMLIASGRHGIIGALVLIEASVNLVVSILLCLLIGPIGVAISSLTVIVCDDIFIIPWIGARRLGVSWRETASRALSGAAIGLSVALAIHMIPLHGDAGFAVRLFMGAALLGGVLFVAWRATGRGAVPTVPVPEV
jgi:O-antigen/teichoic acid export membrane protein